MSLEERENTLKNAQVCRFCLCHNNLGNIFQKDARLKSSAPLTIQVTLCASLEIFFNDGLPAMVCLDCRLLFEHSYRFKQMCKRAETLLKQFPLTGSWPEPLPRPRIPPETPTILNKLSKPKVLDVEKTSFRSLLKSDEQINAPKITSNTTMVVKKILNANPVATPEPPIPKRLKKERQDLLLSKLETDDVILLEDLQNFVADENIDDQDYKNEEQQAQPSISLIARKPKLLNKQSFRILNKEANVVHEPRLSEPTVKRDQDGNMEIVTEILDPNTPIEPDVDHTRTAEPVETNVFPCPKCERSFPLRQLRDIHVINHSRERSFLCENCDKSFFSKYDLKKHSLVHLAERPFKCTICDRGFSRKNLLQRHEKVHIDIPKFICIYCEMPFISKEEMEEHTAKHTRSRPYQCKHCDKSFAFKQGLERHEVVHSIEQPYPCQYCDLSFSTAGKLARHLTAHAGKRPHPCKYCKKSYLLSHHLTRHMRSHKQQDNNISFSCSACSAETFKTREDLINHSITHASEMLKCTLCNQEFTDVATATEHIKEHARFDSFSCTFCDLMFMTSEQLDEHIGDEHLDDMEEYNTFDKSTENALKEAMECEDSVLQQSIDDFLIDDVVIKKENLTVTEISTPIEITNEIVLRPIESLISNADFSQTNEDTEPQLEQLKTQEPTTSNDDESSSKLRKLNSNVIQKSSPQISLVRRKLRNDSKISTDNKQKTDKLIQPTINTVLKTLPKGITIRKEKPESTSSSQQQDISEDNSTDVMKKSTKVKKITVTKEEAAALLKDGRLRFKNGNMVMTSLTKK